MWNANNIQLFVLVRVIYNFMHAMQPVYSDGAVLDVRHWYGVSRCKVSARAHHFSCTHAARVSHAHMQLEFPMHTCTSSFPCTHAALVSHAHMQLEFQMQICSSSCAQGPNFNMRLANRWAFVQQKFYQHNGWYGACKIIRYLLHGYYRLRINANILVGTVGLFYIMLHRIQLEEAFLR